MIVLVVHSSPETVDLAVDTLKATRAKEILTATSFRAGVEAGEELRNLDVLFTGALRGDEASGFDLREKLRERFPGLKTIFIGRRESFMREGEATVKDPIVRLPGEESTLLEWAAEAGLGRRRMTAIPASDAEKAGGDEEVEDLPTAQTVAAPARELADYRLVRLLHTEQETETHEAVQQSVDRRVALVLLKPEYCASEEWVREFRGRVRAKAAIIHPNITPVYEGFEDLGVLFYTRELIDGYNLTELAAGGEKLSPRAIYGVITVVAECMKYFQAQGFPHVDLTGGHVYVGRDGKTRLSNIATLEPINELDTPDHIRALGEALQPLLGAKGGKPDLMPKLLDIMASEEYSIESWDELLELMEGIDDRIAESDRAQPHRAQRAWRRRSKKKIGAAAVGTLVALGLITFLAWPRDTAPPAPEVGTTTSIRGGDFIFQDKGTRNLRTFEIDRYEVTIGQYAEFLEAMETEKNPRRFDHFLQKTVAPEKADHVPESWDEFYPAAKSSGTYLGQPIDLRCPIMLVDWWDAWAYATWKDRRLPTETEWERAARGDQGNLYPWGDEFDFTKLNTARTEDKYSYWSPVDAFNEDASPEGVVGMAGNVSEWVHTWMDHPEIPDKKVPMARGASFATNAEEPGNFSLTNRDRLFDPSERQIYIGFRTVSRRGG
ncbi:MAG: SUMF1/EgtB/PvdO family nonheme iron enzyme [Verrucomicrobiota bacterium]